MGLGRKELVAGGLETGDTGTWEQVREGVRELVGIVPCPRCSTEWLGPQTRVRTSRKLMFLPWTLFSSASSLHVHSHSLLAQATQQQLCLLVPLVTAPLGHTVCAVCNRHQSYITDLLSCLLPSPFTFLLPFQFPFFLPLVYTPISSLLPFPFLSLFQGLVDRVLWSVLKGRGV